MAGTWSYPKTWIDLENLTNEDLNAQFQAVLDNFQPAGMDDYSADVDQMQLQTSPGDLGSESLPVSLAGEIERIRFQIAAIIGQPYWYQKPAASLSAGKPDVVLSAPFIGLSAYETYSDLITRGGILNSRLGAVESFDVSNFQNTNKKFGDYPIIVNGGILAMSARARQSFKDSLSLWMRNYTANHHIAFNIQKGIYLRLNSLGRLESTVVLPQALTEDSKQNVSNIHTDDISAQSSWKNLIVQIQQGNVGGVGTDRISSYVDNDDEQSAGTNFSINQGDGGVWFFGCDKADPVWDKFSAMLVDPAVEASDPWVFSGTAGQVAVANGVLTITSTGTQTSYYEKSNGIDLSQQTIELKMRLNISDPAVSDVNQAPFAITIRDDSMNRSCYIGFLRDRLIISETLAADAQWKPIFVDDSQYHVYRFVFSGSPDPILSIYVDGVIVGTVTLTNADATATDLIRFGDIYGGATQVQTTQIEWFAYADSAVQPVAGFSSSGNLDDILSVQDYWNESARGAIQAYAARIALGLDKKEGNFDQLREGVFIPPINTDWITTSTTLVAAWTASPELRWFYSDGKKKSKITLTGKVSNSGAGSETYLYLGLLKTGTNPNDPFLAANVTDIARMGGPIAAGTGLNQTVTIVHEVLLPAGLYIVAPYIADPSATTGALVADSIRVNVS